MWAAGSREEEEQKGAERLPLTASLGADRLGGRGARSGVGAAVSAAWCLGPDLQYASGRRAAAAARGEAGSSPPRDVSASRIFAGGPEVPSLAEARTGAGSRGFADRGRPEAPGFQKQAREQDVNCISSAEKEVFPPLPATANILKKALHGNGLPYNDGNGRNIHVSCTSEW